jgi:hypothetical protein
VINNTARFDGEISMKSIRERRLFPETPKETPMRILFGITVAAALGFAFWSVSPTAGEARTTVSIHPLEMMATTTNALPEEHCDQGTIF